MTTTDLWHEVDIDHTAVALMRAQDKAYRALADQRAFVCEAVSKQAFHDRLALVADDVRKVVSAAAGDGVAFAITHQAVLEDIERDHAAVMQRRAQEAAELRREREAAGRRYVDPDKLAARRAERQAAAAKLAATYSPTAPANFIADFDKLQVALEGGGWIMTLDDGSMAISPDAPPDIVRMYQSLLQMGYANGHFAKAAKLAAAPSQDDDERTSESTPARKAASFSHFAALHEAASEIELARWQETLDDPIRQHIQQYLPYMTYGPGYDRNITENVFDLVKFWNWSKSFDDKSVAYVQSKLDAAIDILNGGENNWFYDNASGRYIQRLFSSKQAGFWEDIDRQLEELKSAKSADDVARILGGGDPGVAAGGTIAFFAGGGGDGSPYYSLLDAGWTTVAYDADYYWAMKAPNGDVISYVEGDIYKGNQLMNQSAKMASVKWENLGDLHCAEIDKVALTVLDLPIGAAWTVTNLGGTTEFASGRSRSVETARTAAMKHYADIFGEDPEQLDKGPAVKTTDDDDDDDPNEPDDGEVPGEDDQVETVDPLSLNVGDTLTVSYTMGTGETGEVEAVFVRNEDDIAFFSGPSGEFGVAERDGIWVDSEGNQFSFSIGSPDETGDTDPNDDADEQGADDEQDDDKKSADDEKPSDDEDDDDKKNPFAKGAYYLTTSANTGSTSGVVITMIDGKPAPIRSMAELVTAIGAIHPDLGPEQVLDLAKAAVARKKEQVGS